MRAENSFKKERTNRHGLKNMNHIAGFLAGLTASMGLGGGFILIIYLSIFTNMTQSAAGGINLLFFLPIALVSSVIHLKNGLIEKRILPVICVAGIAGSAAGVMLMRALNENMLRNLFAGLLFMVGLRELFHVNRKTGTKKTDVG